MDRLRKDAQRAEVRVATVYGGQLISGSGSTIGRKADVQTSDELIEVKYTTRGSYSVKAGDMAKLIRAGHIADKDPVLNITFDLNGTLVHYVVIPETQHLRDRALIEGLRFELDM